MAVAHLPSRLCHEFKPSLSSPQKIHASANSSSCTVGSSRKLLSQMRKPGTAPKLVCFTGISRRCSSEVHSNNAQIFPSRRVQSSCHREIRLLSSTAQATGSGIGASLSDSKENDISLRDVQLVVESRDDSKIQVRVDLTGEETDRVLDDVLKKLARTAPPIPGFRKTKGGKTSNIPKSFLLQILGRDRVYKFVIQEIISTTIRDYVTKENLKVGSKCDTIQTAEELESAFSPGSTFGFNAILELESEPETSEPSSSEE